MKVVKITQTKKFKNSEFCKLSPEAKSLKLGIYEHYKGNKYQVLGVAVHSETLEELVVYKALYGEELTWVRPLKRLCFNLNIHSRWEFEMLKRVNCFMGWLLNIN